MSYHPTYSLTTRLRRGTLQSKKSDTPPLTGMSYRTSANLTSRFRTREGYECGIKFQVCDVHRPLLSVSALTARGNKVKFHETGGAITSQEGKQEIKFAREGGVYVLTMYIPSFQGPGLNSTAKQPVLAPALVRAPVRPSHEHTEVKRKGCADRVSEEVEIGQVASEHEPNREESANLKNNLTVELRAPICLSGDVMNEFERNLENLRFKRQTSLTCESEEPSRQPCDGTMGITRGTMMLNPFGVNDGVDHQEEEEEIDQRVRSEEAVTPTIKKEPRTPTTQERAEHEATHLPFRSWCRQCVEGRMENRPHPQTLQLEHEVPTVLLDYGFVAKTGNNKRLTSFIMKDRDSKVTRLMWYCTKAEAKRRLLNRPPTISDALATLGSSSLRQIMGLHSSRFEMEYFREPTCKRSRRYPCKLGPRVTAAWKTASSS